MSVHASEPVEHVVVTGDGQGVTSQAGTHLLGRIAGRLGLSGGLSGVLASTVSRASAYDRGRLLVQTAMMLAAGGRCLSDLKVLRDQPDLFGTVASTPTAWRALHTVGERHLEAVAAARREATSRLVEHASDGDITLDIDATLVEVDSDRKQGAAGTFKGGFGFAPMCCFIEPLGLPAGMLRPGNATATDTGDQLTALDDAIGSLPAVWQAGHRPGDDAAEVVRRLRVRADTAAGTGKMLVGLADRNVVFYVGMRVSDAAAAAVADIDDDAWSPAVNGDGRPRDGAQVCEQPDLVPSWAPDGTRAIVRRERAHPGASLRLWDHDGWRHQVTLTNDLDGDPAGIEAFHRARAGVENRIKQLKDTGLARLPFGAWDANRVWFELVLIATLLLAALRTLVDDEQLSVAEPRRLRYALLAVAARITRHARRVWLKLDRSWPWTDQLLAAHERLTAIPTLTG